MDDCEHAVPRDFSVVCLPIKADLQPLVKGQFPPELWPLILVHLRNDTPPARSRPARPALRQPHLAICMRVSKEFKHLVEPLLYTHVTLDNFTDTLTDWTSQHAERRFDLTRSLRIEYPPKGEEPTYMMLMVRCPCEDHPLWGWVGQ
ncbi:uncharacterized protein MKK02DRAFT_39498 [Dioszegia hungarica]|uniref:Uncharacterized protein n=1 Tax=Dioszegia hungarica TaxID=4972 RepID=A0AA38LWW9_9TREE|nr:uncharacterized protein MKK02DRAFT_39498 [Dioszegia hungarica]KAI9639207.1 hypothetical protein MKK02DRAFT_39498 [Dioszegia hungarica]